MEIVAGPSTDFHSLTLAMWLKPPEQTQSRLTPGTGKGLRGKGRSDGDDEGEGAGWMGDVCAGDRREMVV